MVQWREVGVTQHAETMGVSVCGVKRMTSWVVTDGSRAVKPVLIGPGGAGEKVMVHEVRVDLCQRKKKQIPSTHQEVLRVTKQDLNMHFLMYSLCWKIKATLPNSKYVIMFIH